MRNTEHRFIDTDPDALEAKLIAAYEKLAGRSLHPTDAEMVLIHWVMEAILQERVQNNYTGNQNIPSRAEGKNLDALAELVYAMSRPDAKAAACTVRFYLSAPQAFAVLIPAGTRVTSGSGGLVWETVQDAAVSAGDAYVDTAVRCQTAGTVGNGYAIGQIDRMIDPIPYCSRCENVTVSGGGSDRPDDDAFYELMRVSMDGYSTAGGYGNYIYHARKASTEIIDVTPNSPAPGTVYIYVLVKGGEPANEEMKNAVFAECNADDVRPLTDYVRIGDPEIVPYQIDFTYWIHAAQTTGSAAIQAKVEAAVQEYVRWQSARLGRDINPSYLIGLLMQTGIKRVELREPAFTPLRDGVLELGREYDYPDTVPQLAKVGTVSTRNGGYEDE